MSRSLTLMKLVLELGTRLGLGRVRNIKTGDSPVFLSKMIASVSDTHLQIGISGCDFMIVVL